MATAQKQDIDLGITRLEYGDSDRPQRAVLTIETSKYYNGGLISDATVYWVGNHSRQNMITFGTGGDYGKRLLVDRDKKATQKNIDTQHNAVFTAEVLASMTQAAKDHYARYVREGVDEYKNAYLAPVAASAA